MKIYSDQYKSLKSSTPANLFVSKLINLLYYGILSYLPQFSGLSFRTAAPACHISDSRICRSSSASFS